MPAATVLPVDVPPETIMLSLFSTAEPQAASMSPEATTSRAKTDIPRAETFEAALLAIPRSQAYGLPSKEREEEPQRYGEPSFNGGRLDHLRPDRSVPVEDRDRDDGFLVLSVVEAAEAIWLPEGLDLGGVSWVRRKWPRTRIK